MFKKIKTKTIIIGSVILTALVLLIGTTFAYFTARVVGNDTAESTQVYAGIMSLELDGTTQVTCNNLYPGGSCTYNFSIENTGTLTTSYELDFVDVLNDFATKSELVYSLNRDSQVVIEEQEAPSINEMILPAVVIAPGAIQQYTLTLTFKETGTDQSKNQDKHFGARVNIRGIDSSNYLQAKVLARHINNTTPEFMIGDPAPQKRENIETSDKYHNDKVHQIDSSKGLVYIASDYEYENGVYTLKNVEQKLMLSKSDEGKYICYSGGSYNYGKTSKCLRMHKMNVINPGDVQYYTAIEGPPEGISLGSDNNKTVGSGYSFDRETGLFSLTNTIDNVSYDGYAGYYTCNSNESVNCSYLYKIGEINGTDGFRRGSEIVALPPGHSLISVLDAYTSEKVSNKLYSKSGLYKTVDYDGDAYYFRGNIKNNYVSFANRLWKIIRVNGDGSIRIIADSKVGNSGFSSGSNKKRAGYTYDNKDETGNDLACTSTNPCVSDYDSVNEVFVNNRNLTDNKIKTYLENWYLDNLKQYDGDIVVNNYCNDTTNTANSSGTSIYYGALNRISNGNPSLICPDTPETYGGYYRLKIGLINADELNMAGLNILSTVSGDFCLNCTGTFRDNADSSNYLYYDEYWHTMTPESGTASSARLLYGYQGSFRYYNAYKPITSRPVRPVINLRSDIQITSGDGSQTNPYVVE